MDDKILSPSKRGCRSAQALCLGVLFLLAFLPPSPSASAQASSAEKHMEEGLSSFQSGAFEQAALSWTEAVRRYEEAGKLPEQIDALNLLAQAYLALGQHKKAFPMLETALALAVQSGDRPRTAVLKAGLGNAYLTAGRTEAAAQYLNEALGLADEQKNAGLSAAVLNNLGNLRTMQKKYADAIDAYTKSGMLAKTSGDVALAARAMINAATAAMKDGRHPDAKARLDQARVQIETLGPSHDKAYGMINIALAYNELRPSLPGSNDALLLWASKLLGEAAEVADRIGDPRASSYAWGHLGNLYETQRRYADALLLTRRAIFAAQQVNAPEALYRWQWQTGRLFKAQGNLEEALSSYRRAVYTLQPLRQEMSFEAGGAHAALRESVRPFLFELADLLLQRAAVTPDPKESEPYLIEARETVELLKAAELRDYFRDDCVDALQGQATLLETVSRTAAVVYPILLPNRLELLVSLPTGLKRVAVPVKEGAITQEIRRFREKLEKRTTREYLPHAQVLYDWLIRPLEADLTSFKIDTLVFVPDGPLRTIPMAALHDGQQFLISKYAVATTLGLNLTDPRPLRRDTVNAFSVGLSEAVQGFPPLPNVLEELQAIRGFYGGAQLINQDFKVARMEQELKESRFNIVHIASHGKFEGDVEKTFVLAFDDKVNMERLGRYVGLFRFREEPLELLTLSACETAAGDDRAALGLAGIAIKAGARSALATLWVINDEASSELVVEFYKQLLDRTVTKAVALQRAQVKMLEDPAHQHPIYWAPFLLLNNWL
jgi:CHAT domain-containing protein